MVVDVEKSDTAVTGKIMGGNGGIIEITKAPEDTALRMMSRGAAKGIDKIGAFGDEFSPR